MKQSRTECPYGDVAGQELAAERQAGSKLARELSEAQKRAAGAEVAHSLLLRDRDAAIAQRAQQQQVGFSTGPRDFKGFWRTRC